jgi:hypothetical protein
MNRTASPIAATMPEAKFRSTKKRLQPSSLRNSEFSHEIKALKPKPAKVKVETEAKAAAKKNRIKIAAFWPVAVGLFLTGFAPEWHAMTEQAGIWAMRFAFPLSLLATHREIGIDEQMAAILPQFSLYAQLPLDGVLMMLTLARGKSLTAAVTQVVLIHGLCAFVLWLLPYLGS